MSSEYASRRMQSIQDELSKIQSRIADIARDEARATERIARATDSLARASSTSSAQMYQGEIRRSQNDLSRLQGKRANEARNLARKQEEFSRAQQNYLREQAQELKESQNAFKKLQEETRQRQLETLQEIRMASLIPKTMAQSGVTPAYSAFISHASEDKAELAKPLAEALVNLGHKIWYDDMTLKVGDSLRRSIDRGLVSARFGIVILSPSFFAKNWPQYELDGLVAKEQDGQKVILPLWHRVSKNDVLSFSPSLADRVALNTAMFTISELAEKLHEVLQATDEGKGA